ncbi:MAG: SDR family NAD(P)-dependent oxidoreductase, partial [Anaerolineae bacterium]
MDDKICMVTGATSGIGRVTAATLAALGAEVLLVGRNPERTQAAVDAIRSATPAAEVHPLLADLRDLEQVRSLAAAVRERWPRLDVLVNNAGAFFPRRKVLPPGVEQTFLVNHL